MDKTNYSAGIGQVSRTVWKTYSKLPYAEATEPKFYEENMEVAARYLKENYKRFGDWTNALAAYNSGPGAWEQVKQGTRKPSPITLHYIQGFKG
jgi:soluble lytic murein transglycosylase-like protein